MAKIFFRIRTKSEGKDEMKKNKCIRFVIKIHDVQIWTAICLRKLFEGKKKQNEKNNLSLIDVTLECDLGKSMRDRQTCDQSNK